MSKEVSVLQRKVSCPFASPAPPPPFPSSLRVLMRAAPRPCRGAQENERKVMEGKRRSVKQVKAMSREASREITRRREEERARAQANKEDIRRRQRELQEKKKKAKVR